MIIIYDWRAVKCHATSAREALSATRQNRTFSKDKGLAAATPEEFDGVSALLKDVYGFGLPANATLSKSSAPDAVKAAKR
jgi:hypothetical protein